MTDYLLLRHAEMVLGQLQAQLLLFARFQELPADQRGSETERALEAAIREQADTLRRISAAIGAPAPCAKN